jgi:hypothetical protein
MFAISFHVEEKPGKTQSSNQLASSLVRAPHSKSGGHKFEYPVWTDSAH